MKRNNKRKKRSVTLIEMIVVMLLIATIAGALAYNYQGSLNEGKAFKTREGMARIKTILSLALAEDNDRTGESVASNWTSFVQNSPLAGKSTDLLKDGWGKDYKVSYIGSSGEGEDFEVSSQGLDTYKAKKNQSPTK